MIVSLPHLSPALRRVWNGRVGIIALITLAALSVAGCDLSGLPIGQQCTPTTCDYVVNSLVAVKGSSGVVELADSNNKLYQFNGSQWQKISDEKATQRSLMLAVDAQTLFLGNTVSTDGGQSWSPLCAVVTAVSPAFAQDKTVFGVNSVISANSNGTPVPGATPPAGPTGCPTSTGPYYRSQDGGQTWSPMKGPPGSTRPDLFILSPNFAQDQTIFATFSVDVNQQPVPALYQSTDGGGTWSKILAGKQDFVALSTNYANDQTVIAVSGTGAKISTDGGQSWQTQPLPVSATQTAQIVFSPTYASDKTILLASAAADTASTTLGTFVSTDGGATWKRTGPATQRGANFPALVFSPNYATDKTIYASSLDLGKGPATSTDLGATWTANATGLDLLQSPG